MDKEIISNEGIENNAGLIFRADFYPIYSERYGLGLSTDEKLILSFIHYWTKNGQWIYATNLQIAMLIESSESTAKRCLKSLKEKGFVSIVEKRTQTGTDRKLRFNKVSSQSLAQFKNELSAEVKLTRAERSNGPAEKNNIKKNNIDISKDISAEAEIEKPIDNESKLVVYVQGDEIDESTSIDENKNTPDLTLENLVKFYYKRRDREINIKACEKAFSKVNWNETTYNMLKTSLVFFKRDKKLKLSDSKIWQNLETLIGAFKPDRDMLQEREDIILEKLCKLYNDDKKKYDSYSEELINDLPRIERDLREKIRESRRTKICLS